MIFPNLKIVTITSLLFATLVVYHLIVLSNRDDKINRLELANASLTNTNTNLSEANDKFSQLVTEQRQSIDNFIIASREASENATKALISAQSNKPSVEKVIRELVMQQPTNDDNVDCNSAAANLRKYYGVM